MAIDTYANLKSAIIDELDRDDLTDKVDDFIDLAEAMHRDGDRDQGIPPIRFREMIVRAQSEFTTRYLSLPTGFLQMKTLRLFVSLSGIDRVVTPTEINLDLMNRRRREVDGIPCFFTIHEEIEFDVDVKDSDPITAEMIYYKELTALSDANQTNALLTKSPGCYLYGSLISAAPWLSEDERLPVWRGLYKSVSAGLVLTARLARYGGPLVSQVQGPTP